MSNCASTALCLKQSQLKRGFQGTWPIAAPGKAGTDFSKERVPASRPLQASLWPEVENVVVVFQVHCCPGGLLWGFSTDNLRRQSVCDRCRANRRLYVVLISTRNQLHDPSNIDRLAHCTQESCCELINQCYW